MNAFLQDIRFGVRLLLKKPGFSVVIILTLALGIGANTAVFSVVNAVVLRPLSFPAPERLVMLWETMAGNDRRMIAPGNLEDWQAQNQSFDGIGAYMNSSLNLSGRGEPQKLTAVAVSSGFFPTLGVPAFRGRTFLPEDALRQDRGAVVLSYRLWQSLFGADPNALGQELSLDEKTYAVVGIMPSDFAYPARAELWILGDKGTALSPSFAAQFGHLGVTSSRDVHILYAFGRLKQTVTPEQAQTELSTIARRLALQYPDTNGGLGANVIRLHEQIVGGSRVLLFVLLGSVALVLLIACANVVNLMLARATQREREIAIRLALGAARWRLIRQMLTESLLLSLTGGLLGFLVAAWVVDVFLRLSPADIPRLNQAGVDAGVLLFTSLISVGTGVAFGAIPAFQATRLDPQNSLQDGGTKSSEGRSRRRTQNNLIIAEIALAQVLLVGAGLLLMSFVRLQATRLGFNSSNLLTGRVSLTATQYSEPSNRIVFYDQMLERVGALPGVRSAALVMSLPLSGAAPNRGFQIQGRPEPKPDENVTLDYQLVSPGYFNTMETPLISGRTFAGTDGENSPRVVVINQTMARKYFPGEEPIGQRIALGDPKKEESWRSIVGVVGDVRYESIETPPFPTAYAVYRQNTEPWSTMSMVLKTYGRPGNLAGDLRRAIQSIDPNLPVTNVQSMEELMDSSVVRPRFIMLLVGSLASIALALAAIGIYGLMAYSVAQRTQEIGIRMALGAQKSDVLGLVIRQGMTLTVIGVVVGLIGAFVLTRLIASLLFGVETTDPLTFVAIPLLLLFVALIACYLPARRAARLDPKIALAQS